MSSTEEFCPKRALSPKNAPKENNDQVQDSGAPDDLDISANFEAILSQQFNQSMEIDMEKSQLELNSEFVFLILIKFSEILN